MDKKDDNLLELCAKIELLCKELMLYREMMLAQVSTLH